MKFRNKTTGAISTEDAIMATMPNVSFPKPVTSTLICGYGYEEVFPATTWPSVTLPYEQLDSDGIEEVDGKWYEKWKVITATGDDKTNIDNDAASSQRSSRNNELKKSDYLALSDVTMSDEWKTYRQALRDLPTASGWPHSHTWPTKPS